MVPAALQELLQLFGIVGDVATWQTFLPLISCFACRWAMPRKHSAQRGRCCCSRCLKASLLSLLPLLAEAGFTVLAVLLLLGIQLILLL